MARVLVVGAGISGLACAFDLVRGGQDVRVLEAGERAGGVVGSLDIDGFRFETGPNTVQASARNFRLLAGELGIAGRMIVSSAQAKMRYLFHRGRLVRLPGGPLSFLLSPLLSAASKWRILTEGFREYTYVPDDEIEPSFEAFLEGRLGREATRRLAGAFVRGVYAAEMDELGARSAFPRLWNLANENGGLLRGMRAAFRGMRREELPGPRTSRSDLLSFASGLGELPDSLAKFLGERLTTGVRVTGLERAPGGWNAMTDSGERVETDHVVLAVPATATHGLLSPVVGNGPGGLHIAQLANVGHAAVTTVHLGLAARNGGEASLLPPGFGYLVPPDEASENPQWGVPSALGTLFVSNLFAGRGPAGTAAVSSFYRTDDVANDDENSLRERALRDLVLATGLTESPEIIVSQVQRWQEVIPRYGVGHGRLVADLDASAAAELPGIALAGNYMGGVSVDDCIARGRAVAAKMLEGPPGGEQ